MNPKDNSTESVIPARCIISEKESEEALHPRIIDSNQSTPEDCIKSGLYDDNQSSNSFNKKISHEDEHEAPDGLNVLRDSNNTMPLGRPRNQSNLNNRKGYSVNEYKSFGEENKDPDLLNVRNKNDSGACCLKFLEYEEEEEEEEESKKNEKFQQSEPEFTDEKDSCKKLMDSFEGPSQGFQLNEIQRMAEESKTSDKFLIKDAKLLKVMGDLNGDHEKALKYYDEACELEPKNCEYHLSKANLLSRLGRYQETIKCCDQAIASGQTSADLLTLKGISEEQLGRKRKAKKCFEKALSPTMEFSDLSIKAQAQAFAGQTQEALKTSNEAIQEHPFNATCYFSKSIALNELGRCEEALKCDDKAIECDEDYSEAYYNKGIALLHLGKYKEAIKPLTQAIDQNPMNHKYFCRRGVARAEAGQLELGLEDENESEALWQEDAIVYNNKADFLNRIGRFEEGLENINKAVQMEPNKNIYSSKGEFEMCRGDLEEALTWFNKALAIEENKHILFWRAKCLLHMWRIEEAVEDFAKVRDYLYDSKSDFHDRLSEDEKEHVYRMLKLYGDK